MKASQQPARVCADIWRSTTTGGRTHRWTGGRPIRHISNRCDQSRSQHNRAGNPLTKRLETVQSNRTTSSLNRDTSEYCLTFSIILLVYALRDFNRSNEIDQEKRKTKAALAADKIEAAIVSCELPPGAVIVEADLTEWLGLGRTPVREALVSLANANLLRLGRGGVIIPEINALTMLKLLELREPIERLCIQKAVDRHKEADLEVFKNLYERLRDIPNGDRPTFMSVLWEIHRAIANASQNEFIHSALRTTQGLSRRYWGHFASSTDQELAKEIYISLLDAIIIKDTEKALSQSQKLICYLRDLTMHWMHEYADPPSE